MTMRKLLTNSRSIKALPGLAALCAAAPAGAVQCTANQINGRWAFFADDAEGDWTVCFLLVRQRRNLSGICDFHSFGESETLSVEGIARTA